MEERLKILIPAWLDMNLGTEDFSERRRYARLMLQLPVEFCLEMPELGKIKGKGVLKDFSLSGAYFCGETSHPLEPGQVLTLTIAAPVSQLEISDISHIKATGEVVRVDFPERFKPEQKGVAINFLEIPSFSPAANFSNFV
jgi:c-di-GMP-binding flagellar brake protein YcgR